MSLLPNFGFDISHNQRTTKSALKIFLKNSQHVNATTRKVNPIVD